MRDAQDAAQSKVSDVEEREQHLTARLNDIQSERARIEKEAAEEKTKFEQTLQTLVGEQAETWRKQKEADERAVEFDERRLAPALGAIRQLLWRLLWPVVEVQLLWRRGRRAGFQLRNLVSCLSPRV